MCFHLSWLSSFERLAYINNHHCFIYLVKAVYCGVPNKPIICLFDFEQSFLSSTVLFSLQVILALSIFEIKRLTVFSSPRLLHPICSDLEQNFYWFKRYFPTDTFIWKKNPKIFFLKWKNCKDFGHKLLYLWFLLIHFISLLEISPCTFFIIFYLFCIELNFSSFPLKWFHYEQRVN